MKMVKTQVYLGKAELEALHRVARRRKRKMADLVRQAVREVWLRPGSDGPISLCDGELRAVSTAHDAAFDDQ